MAKILGTDKDSKCMYCGQQSYGIGCPYAPSRVHVHVDDPKRCIYCGHTGYGIGCPYNPTSRTHIHGVEFNNAMKESTDRIFTAQFLITRLTQPIIESPAYKIGLIDESGKRVRLPETDEEKAAFTPIDAYCFRLRRMIGEDRLALLDSTVLLELLSMEHKPFQQQLHESEITLRERIAQLVHEYKSVVNDGSQMGFSMNDIERMFLETVSDAEIS